MAGYYDLYQQALRDIDALGVPNWSKNYFPAVSKRHRELVKQHKPDDIPIDLDGFDGDMRLEDRETRIASGQESWAPGGAV